jgi:predicted transposase/invertase (TIGR01784 family)
MKTDSLFYRLFQSFPWIFFEIINRPREDSSLYQFASVEIKQTSFRLDGVFLPKTEENQPIYFLEVQFQTDPDFYSRFFAEIFLYLHQTDLKNDWQGVIIYPSRGVDTSDTTRYRELLNNRRVQRVYLDELDSSISSLAVKTVKLVIEPEETAVNQAKELINQAQTEIVDEVTQRNFIQLIETIIVYKLPRKTLEEIQAMFGLSELKQTKVYQQGLEEGRQEGRQEGKIELQLESIPRLLALGLTVEQIANAFALDVEVVQKMANQPSDNGN